MDLNDSAVDVIDEVVNFSQWIEFKSGKKDQNLSVTKHHMIRQPHVAQGNGQAVSLLLILVCFIQLGLFSWVTN